MSIHSADDLDKHSTSTQCVITQPCNRSTIRCQYLTSVRSFVPHHYSSSSFLYTASLSLHFTAKMPEILDTDIGTLTAEDIAMFQKEVT